MHYYLFNTFAQSNLMRTLNTNVLCNHRYPSVDCGPVKAFISYSMAVTYAFIEKGVFVSFCNSPCSKGNDRHM